MSKERRPSREISPVGVPDQSLSPEGEAAYFHAGIEDTRNPQDANAALLDRIAKTLGVTRNALRAAEPIVDRSATEPTAEECMTLFNLYTSIPDPLLRQRCIEILKLVASAPL